MTESAPHPEPRAERRRTLIHCGQLVAFDGTRHRLLRDIDLVVKGDSVEAINPPPGGRYDEVIDARRRIVMPGFVNLHTHTGTTAPTRLVTERRFPALFNAGYLAFSPKKGSSGIGSRERARIGGLAATAELLKSGTTTVVDLGQGCDPAEMVDVFGELGIRAYTAPGFRSGYHVFDEQGRIEIYWQEDGGLGALANAVEFIERYDGSYGGRIHGMLMPYQGDTCSDALLIAARQEAQRLGVKMTMHAAQSLFELHEMMRRTNRTTIQHFADVGFLGPDFIIAHCPFVTGHPATGLPGDEDLRLLAEHRVSVCHNPTTIFRRGHLLRSFSRYQAYGLNMCLGTDHYPRDMVHEMRLAALMGKVTEDDPGATTSLDVFNAATIGGATALGRPDLGRLYPGSKADLIIVDLNRIGAVPLRDPVQDLVLCGQPSDIKLVMVDGRTVCRNGEVPGVDEEQLLAALQANSEEIYADIPTWHWDGWDVDRLSPRFVEPMERYAYSPTLRAAP